KTWTTVSAWRRPTTRLTISLVSGSMITWSHWLPRAASSGSSGSHCLPFFPHKGPSLVGLDLLGLEAANPVVVEVFGVLAEPLGEAQDGVEADLAQPRRGAAATAIREVLRDGDEGSLRGAQAKQRRVGAFGEVRAAGDTMQTADAVAAAGPAVQAQVAGTALAVGGTVRVGAGEVRVVCGAHGFFPSSLGSPHFMPPGTGREALRSHHRFARRWLPGTRSTEHAP